jgi:uncharacterized protein YutE (UPF0331/DUF86 family)
MTPIDVDLISRKRDFILRELRLLKELQKRRVNARSELLIQHALVHSVQNLISAVIDIAQHIVAEKGSAPPSSYADSIAQLGTLGVLPAKFATEFSHAAKMRNILVHAYENLNVELVVKALPQLIRDTQKFLRAVNKFE